MSERIAGHALVTGGAGFIGSHLVDQLLAEGWHVTVVDDFNDFYTPRLKRHNIVRHRAYRSYTLVEADIRDAAALDAQLRDRYDVIVHLAARAGIRPSIVEPLLYQDVNVRGTQNLLEFARTRRIPQFVFASSSSVYGINPRTPWHEEDAVLRPISPYASTKISGELLGHTYAHLYGMRFIALRFFTVYGPRQRPDLAINSFTQKMLAGERIPVFGDGTTLRDYTFVGDIVDGIRSAMHYQQTPYEVINLGNNQPVALRDLLSHLSVVLGKPAHLEFLPMPAGDVPQTWACIDKANALLGYQPTTDLATGLRRFAEWLDERYVIAA